MTPKNRQELAREALKRGNRYPFDAPDDWWKADRSEPPPAATDWAHRAARGVIADLQDRRTIKYNFAGLDIDEDIRVKIVLSLAEIIREAEHENT